jgi:DNA (cytosine-5)-methyltransferase 1
MMKPVFKFIDLFAGIGGFRLALNNLGGECVGFSEIDKDAIVSYCDNFEEPFSANFGDVTKITTLPEHDLLTGGVPCQSWSIAGKNLGFDDDRGKLWNDAIYLLKKTNPKAFIFENVKGLSDPRNTDALYFIMQSIKLAGYYSNYYLINSSDYGVPQNRIRVYIVGFKQNIFFERFKLPKPFDKKVFLADVLEDVRYSNHVNNTNEIKNNNQPVDLLGDFYTEKKTMSLSNNNGFNDYFLFNDLRNGHTTIHSWDIIDTTEKQKKFCLTLLKNRRKTEFGNLDGNPLSLLQLQSISDDIEQQDIDELLKLNILSEEIYSYKITDKKIDYYSTDDLLLISLAENGLIIPDLICSNKQIKKNKVPVSKVIERLLKFNFLMPVEIRYDFKNTKISTGLNGVNRVFLPESSIFPTLVASDTNDYVTNISILANSEEEYKNKFLNEIYKKNNFRKITQKEACKIQGFPTTFKLPESRVKWMKLIGNSVSVPVVQMLAKAMIDTGVFEAG